MNIFESLEELNVSEECFNDILNITEKIINEWKLYDKVEKSAMQMQENPNPLKRTIGNIVRKGLRKIDSISNSKIGDIIRKNPVIQNTYGKKQYKEALAKANKAIADREAFKKSADAERVLRHRVDGDEFAAKGHNFITKANRDSAVQNLKDTAKKFGLDYKTGKPQKNNYQPIGLSALKESTFEDIVSMVETMISEYSNMDAVGKVFDRKINQTEKAVDKIVTPALRRYEDGKKATTKQLSNCGKGKVEVTKLINQSNPLFKWAANKYAKGELPTKIASKVTQLHNDLEDAKKQKNDMTKNNNYQ